MFNLKSENNEHINIVRFTSENVFLCIKKNSKGKENINKKTRCRSMEENSKVWVAMAFIIMACPRVRVKPSKFSRHLLTPFATCYLLLATYIHIFKK